MMGGAKAEEAPTTDEMTYNATEGKFVQPDGDPETQEGILNWIGEHPIYSGLAADTGWYGRRTRSRSYGSARSSQNFSRVPNLFFLRRTQQKKSISIKREKIWVRCSRILMMPYGRWRWILKIVARKWIIIKKA